RPSESSASGLPPSAGRPSATRALLQRAGHAFPLRRVPLCGGGGGVPRSTADSRRTGRPLPSESAVQGGPVRQQWQPLTPPQENRSARRVGKAVGNLLGTERGAGARVSPVGPRPWRPGACAGRKGRKAV